MIGRAARRLLAALAAVGAPGTYPPRKARPCRSKLGALRRRGLAERAGTGWRRTAKANGLV